MGSVVSPSKSLSLPAIKLFLKNTILLSPYLLRSLRNDTDNPKFSIVYQDKKNLV